MVWLTNKKTGKPFNTDWLEKDKQIKQNQINVDKLNSKKDSNISNGQRAYEEKIRNSKKEFGAYFDKDGNLLMQSEGDENQVSFGGNWDSSAEFNHKVEQRIWNDEDIHFTHNHPDNTIFSPEDVETFEDLEAKSESAVLANGTIYRLIREQPRSSNEWVYDEKINDFKRSYEPKKIAPAYNEAYSKIWDEGYAKLPRWGDPNRKRLEAELDKKVMQEMEKWFIKNATKYGYRFVKE